MSVSARTTEFDRRGLFLGAGAIAAGAAIALGEASPVAAAETAPDGRGAGTDAAPDATPVTATIASAPVTGRVYRHATMFDFFSEYASAQPAWGGYGVYSSPSSYLWTSIEIPAGALIRDIEWYVYNTSGTNYPLWARLWVPGSGTLNTPVLDLTATSGSDVRAFRGTVPSSNYGPFPPGVKLMLGVGTSGSFNLQVNGARVGFSRGAGEVGMLSAPERILDTRSGNRIGSGSTRTVKVPAAVAPTGTSAVLLKVTALSATGSGALTIYPSGVTRPGSTSLNFTTSTIGTTVLVRVPSDRKLKVYTSKTVHVLLDAIATIG
ncbi:hypothetical protein [Microbacterium terricola]|uniref:Uncharacterized protein n=1 Tax=Microbacterium terricola TaxID=344163 RepID=A0ABM8DV61_9MICO|nr:hypothetical protein [Microbacterium terricola]UYK39792.1 hypothetical protein OAU46_14015 [Microbacterium terricola]BDV29457.1 hypothetical protein Microterr_01170 [Microbacterium terricola]